MGRDVEEKKNNNMLTTQVQKQYVLSERMLLHEVVQQCHQIFSLLLYFSTRGLTWEVYYSFCS